MRQGMTYLKKNDQVEVIAGKDKGRVGKVLRVLRDKDKAVVERINLIKRHTKPTRNESTGPDCGKRSTNPCFQSSAHLS